MQSVLVHRSHLSDKLLVLISKMGASSKFVLLALSTLVLIATLLDPTEGAPQGAFSGQSGASASSSSAASAGNGGSASASSSSSASALGSGRGGGGGSASASSAAAANAGGGPGRGGGFGGGRPCCG